MAYGRLDVFFPNGDFSTYLLDSASVSVGRSAGCTIVLDTDTISRYHFSITYDGKEVKISDMDSANGTFVDGVQLNTDESKTLLGGEELQIGHLRMIYYTLQEDPTTLIDPIAEETQRYDRPDVGFLVEVFGSEIAIPPGSHTTVEISITNMTKEEHSYTIDAIGLPEGWGRLNRPVVNLDPDETAQVIYNIKPVRQSTSKPGDYPIHIVVTQQDDTENRIEASVSVKILPYAGFGVALANPNLLDGEPFRLFLLNQGSAPLPLHISGYHADSQLQFDIPQANTTLAPGQRMEVRGKIKPKQRRLFGAERQFDFDLRVKSKELPGFLTAVPAHYTEKAMFPNWVAYAIAGVSVFFMLFVLGILILATQQPAPQPQIVRLITDKTTVVAGDVVQVNWQAQDVKHYTVRVNNVIVADELPVTETDWFFDTGGYEGIVRIELIATNGEKRATAVQNITVHPRIEVTYYTITPDVITRNLIQTVRLDWTVYGTETITISNIPTLPQQAPVPSAGLYSYGQLEATILIDVDSDTFFLLTAEDAMGNISTHRPQYTVVDAECFTLVEGVQSRNFPDANAQVLQTFDASASRIVIDGRDMGATWLRTRIQGGVSAWVMREQVTCNFTVDELLPVNLPAPTAVPATSTPTATLPPTPTNMPAPTSTPRPTSTTAP